MFLRQKTRKENAPKKMQSLRTTQVENLLESIRQIATRIPYLLLLVFVVRLIFLL